MKIPKDMTAGYKHIVRDGELEVIRYMGCFDVLVKFTATGNISSFRSESIRNGTAKDRMLPSIFGIGYIGIGEHKALAPNRKRTSNYERWYHMLERCYCPKHQKRYPTYSDCSVCDEWHNFQNFADWCDANNPNGDPVEIDKDGIVPGNRVYSPENCQLVPKQRNIEITFAKKYCAKSPSGEVISFYNLSKFCRENGLSAKNLHMVISGKRMSHKGWTAV